METRIKTGEGLLCEYTGKPSVALVKLSPDGPGGTETGWLGEAALMDALRLLHAAGGRNPLVEAMRNNSVLIPDPPAGETFGVDRPPPPPPRPGAGAMDPPNVIQDFARELHELVENPPKARDNEREGLSETHIRDLIRRHLRNFRNPAVSMFPPLNSAIGMTRERLDVILEALKA